MPIRRSDTMRAVDAVMPLVDEFNALDEGDKLTFLDLVDPLPEGHNHKPKKKASRKSSQSSSSKSPRATGIEQQLNKRREQGRAMVTTRDDDDAEARCVYRYPKDSSIYAGMPCNMGESYAVHDPAMGYAGYHEFTTGKPAVPAAPASSPANGESVDESASVATGD